MNRYEEHSSLVRAVLGSHDGRLGKGRGKGGSRVQSVSLASLEKKAERKGRGTHLPVEEILSGWTRAARRWRILLQVLRETKRKQREEKAKRVSDNRSFAAADPPPHRPFHSPALAHRAGIPPRPRDSARALERGSPRGALRGREGRRSRRRRRDGGSRSLSLSLSLLLRGRSRPLTCNSF